MSAERKTVDVLERIANCGSCMFDVRDAVAALISAAKQVVNNTSTDGCCPNIVDGETFDRLVDALTACGGAP